MKFIPKALTLNGKYFSEDAIHGLADDLMTPGKPDWEQALGSFLRQWIDENDTIQVRTSGSTGDPKLLSLSKRSMLTSASMTGSFLGFREGQTALLCLNSGFIAGMMMVVRAMAYQMNLIAVPPSGSPLCQISKERIDFAAMVPAQVYNSLPVPSSKQILESIGTLIIGGAALSPELEKMIEKLDGNIYATFGMTETITHIALRRLNGPERSDAFTVLPGITIESDVRGCLVASVPWDAGKIVSNDIVSIESPASFKWLGRADNVINTGGIKLIPETIEKRIAEFVGNRFFIAGLPDPVLGNIPVLVVESVVPLTAKQIEEISVRITPKLTKSEMPRRVIRSEKFSETGNGKINRKESLQQALKT
ncbi:MAG: O-succinylbenzoic acid--CoA ligase [Bacteroidetes bacterium]|nr:MAG: O-succinylbenzoic acid--CoA ligase [Bacteroidota bacterium]